jgi:hypothetical protein
LGKVCGVQKWQKIPKSKLARMGVRILHAIYVLVFLQGTLPCLASRGELKRSEFKSMKMGMQMMIF